MPGTKWQKAVSSVFPGCKVGRVGSTRLSCRGLEAGGQENRKSHNVKAQDNDQEGWLMTRSQPVTYKAVNQTPTITITVCLGGSWCAALRYWRDLCSEFGHLLEFSARDSGQPECPVHTPLVPELALPCLCWGGRCRAGPSPLRGRQGAQGSSYMAINWAMWGPSQPDLSSPWLPTLTFLRFGAISPRMVLFSSQ